MYSCISCDHIEIIKVYVGQNLSCVQVTGNKEFTTGGLNVPHLQVFTYLYNQKTRTDVQSYACSSSAFLVHFK